MEVFLRALLPRLLPAGRTFEIHSFQGKPDLLGKIESRLRGYASWLPDDWRVIVVVDRDEDDCRRLKRRVELAARNGGLCTRGRSRGKEWQFACRIAIEELEAWYFGDWQAVCAAYPRTVETVPRRAAYRDPDAIKGGTWEAFERVMRLSGYFRGGLMKIEAARAIGAQVDPSRNTSPSFCAFARCVFETMA